jgi:peptide/nickel transport system ATP-binding protein
MPDLAMYESGGSVLEVRDLRVHYRGPARSVVQAVRGVTFSLGRGEILGLVGESGSGKSSLARALLQLPRPTAGSVMFGGHDLATLRGRALRSHRARMPIVMQNPAGSLNPRRPVHSIIGQALLVRGVRDRSERRARTHELLELVGLDPANDERRPTQLSGGQCQRVSIARALACEPEILICDEVVSALDVSAQGRIVNLLGETRQQFGFASLFISHNLAVVKRICDRVAVMYLGQLVELAPVTRLYSHPRHPYTVQLLESVVDGTRASRKQFSTTTTAASRPDTGCPFRDRCPRAQERCVDDAPALTPDAGGSFVACHFPVPE